MPSLPILFSIDPGSRVSGLAVYEGLSLLHWALLKVPSSRDPVQRCLTMSAAIAEFINEVMKGEEDRTITVVVELPGGRSNRWSRGLVTLGMAVGMIIAYLTAIGHRVVTLRADEWTKLDGPRCLPKAVRAAKIEEMFPKYQSEEDKSLDGADAIGLGAYFLGLFKSDTPKEPE
jgi:hypothetical protein